MRRAHILRRWSRATVFVGLVALAGAGASAQNAVVKAGHTELTLPTGLAVFQAPLDRQFTQGDPVRIDRQVVLLSGAASAPVAALLIESTREAGRFIWTESCKKLDNDANTFVHTPFHAMGNECVFAVGLVDLSEVIRNSFPEVAQTLRQGGQTLPAGAGYVVKSTYAAASGSMLSVTVFIGEAQAKLSTPPESMPDGTGLPVPVVAWARALNDQVRGAMRSFSGAWQLPPLMPAPP